MRYGEIYLYRTRRAPRSVLRHNAYVGQTRNPTARHGEHMNGGGRYGKPPSPWSDLHPTRYVLFRMRHCPQWLLNLAERVAILVFWPVYNDKMNRWNPRRVPIYTAKAARAARDAGRRAPVRYGPYQVFAVILGIGAIYAGMFVILTHLARG